MRNFTVLGGAPDGTELRTAYPPPSDAQINADDYVCDQGVCPPGMFWSETAQMFWHHESNMFFDPTKNAWWDVATKRWKSDQV